MNNDRRLIGMRFSEAMYELRGLFFVLLLIAMMWFGIWHRSHSWEPYPNQHAVVVAMEDELARLPPMPGATMFGSDFFAGKEGKLDGTASVAKAYKTSSSIGQVYTYYASALIGLGWTKAAENMYCKKDFEVQVGELKDGGEELRTRYYLDISYGMQHPGRCLTQ
jgi:hypothetical protein